MPLNPDIQLIDHARAYQLIIAWLDNDPLMIEDIMRTASTDRPGAAKCLLLALAAISGEAFLTAAGGKVDAARQAVQQTSMAALTAKE